jgi:hypothetical protein
MLLGGGAICFGMGWIISLVALDYMIATDFVKSSSDYWDLVKTIYIVLLLPPIYISLFKILPDSEQEIINENTKVTALAFIYIGDWIGKGVLLAIGYYFVARHFNLYAF